MLKLQQNFMVPLALPSPAKSHQLIATVQHELLVHSLLDFSRPCVHIILPLADSSLTVDPLCFAGQQSISEQAASMSSQRPGVSKPMAAVSHVLMQMLPLSGLNEVMQGRFVNGPES